MRMRNFQHIDPTVSKKSLSHIAKLDKEIFAAFQNDWGELSWQAEEITGLNIFDFNDTPDKGSRPLSNLYDHNKTSRERAFFRAGVHAAYNNCCCITGMQIPTFLVASHIKPYSKCQSAAQRVSPHNGLLLNVLHDKAFDRGYITITKDSKIWVSEAVKKYVTNAFVRQQLIDLEGKTIIKSKTFLPDPECLEYHNDIIFKGANK